MALFPIDLLNSTENRRKKISTNGIAEGLQTVRARRIRPKISSYYE